MNENIQDPKLEGLYQRLSTIRNTRVGDIMTRNVITLDSNDLLATAARTMIENHINGIVVMKDGRPWSILTSYDLLHKSYIESFSDKMDYLRSTLEHLIETPTLHYLRPSDSLDSAARMFSAYALRTIPVLEEATLVGVISLTDLVKSYSKLVIEPGI